MDRFAIENPTYVVTVSTGKCDKCIKIIAKCAFAFVITTFIVGVATVRIHAGRGFDFSPEVLFWIASALVVLIWHFDGWWIRKEYKFTKTLVLLNIILVVFYLMAFIHIQHNSPEKSLNITYRPSKSQRASK